MEFVIRHDVLGRNEINSTNYKNPSHPLTFAGATELESCPTDATPEVAPGEPSVCLPLCCDPNEFRNSNRGHLTRWNH